MPPIRAGTPAPVGRPASAVPHASVSRERPARRRASATHNGERGSTGLLDEQPGHSYRPVVDGSSALNHGNDRTGATMKPITNVLAAMSLIAPRAPGDRNHGPRS